MLSEIMKKYCTVDVSKMRPPNFNTEVNKKWADMAKRVQNGSGCKNVTSCPVCSSEKYTFEFKKFEIDLVACSECGLRYHTKVPDNISDVYNDPSYIKESAGFWSNDYEYRKERFGKERVKILSNIIGDLKGKSILDVGCGTGYFLTCALEQGADCYGLEISKDIRQWVSQRLGIEVFDKPLELLETEIQFDAITVFDLIEHLEKPVEFLSTAHRFLKDDGVIFIYTPNFDCFSIRIMKERSNIICPSSHLLFFDNKSLHYALKKSGFEAVYSATCGMDIEDIISMFNADGNRNYFLDTWKEQLQAMIDYANCGSSIRCIAIKS